LTQEFIWFFWEMSTVVLLLSMTFLGGPPLEVQFEDTVRHVAPLSLVGANGNIWSNYFELGNPLFIQASDFPPLTCEKCN